MAAAPDDPNLPGNAAPPPGGMPATGGNPPQAPPAQAAAPTPKAGNDILAQVHIQTAMQMLKSALGLMPDTSTKEYKTLLDVMKKMVSTYGMQTEAQSLVPAQVLQMVRSVQQNGSAPVSPQ